GNFDSHIWTNEFRGFQRGVYLKGANAVVGRQFRSTGSNMLPQDNEFYQVPTTTYSVTKACFISESDVSPPSGSSFDWDLRLPIGSVYYPVALNQGFYVNNGTNPIPSVSMNLVNNAQHLYYSVCDFSPSPGPEPQKQGDSVVYMTDSTRLLLMESMVEASNPNQYVVLDSDASQILERNTEGLYRAVYEWNPDLSDFTVLDSLEQAMSGGDVEGLILLDLLLSAQLDSAVTNHTISLVNRAKQAHKRFQRFIEIEDRVLWDSNAVYPYTPSETDSLVAWAELCPDLNGNFVYRVRNVLNFWKTPYTPCVLSTQIAMKGKKQRLFGSEVNQSCALLMYPNPSKDLVYISGCSEDDGVVQVFDSFGSLKLKIAGQSGQEVIVNLTDWPKGVYFVIKNSKSGSISTGLISKY
ncbi:T9SS type A sorting domain-containing protein, partial [bacterium]|nr:T9SS type A sorting domain-containing protein [bacterium]